VNRTCTLAVSVIAESIIKEGILLKRDLGDLLELQNFGDQGNFWIGFSAGRPSELSTSDAPTHVHSTIAYH